MKTLNLIGCGAVGRVLGRLLHERKLFEIQDILTQSPESAAEGASFVGAGRAVAGYAELRPADLYMVAVGDAALAASAGKLAALGVLRPGAIVFHLSGALPSSILAPAAEAGALVASVHPVQSFADPAQSVSGFAGTPCGIEGDPVAVEILGAAFAALGGKVFGVDSRFKTLYHAGSVLVCNYLTALMEAGIRTYGKGGLSRETALEVMEPLVRGTVENVFRVGTARALTGPIARGDGEVVAAQLAALEGWDPAVARIYRSLGAIALELSRERGAAAEADLARLKEILEP